MAKVTLNPVIEATWSYTATTALAQGQAVSIEVSATDRPGHEGTKTVNRP